MALAGENGYSYWLAWGTILQGWAVAERGHAAVGMATLRAGLGAYRATGAELFCSYALALLAEICGKAGRASEGLDLVAEALDSVRENNIHFCEAELHRLKADLLLMNGASEELAAPHFAHAANIARAQGALLLELRSAVGLCRLGSTVQGKAKMRRRLAAILAGFTDDVEFDDLAQARAAIERR